MYSRQLIIFEGPDGAGKTTAAKALAEKMDAHYVHLGPFPKLGDHLASMYVDAMMPAVLGHKDVIMDRSWYSEEIYGPIIRQTNRMDIARRRSLERLAMRCATVVIRCHAPWQTIKTNWESRKGREMVNEVAQMHKVWLEYALKGPSWGLPSVHYDYSECPLDEVAGIVRGIRTVPHLLRCDSAGNARAKILLVGESPADHCIGDHLYQWPFGTLSNTGCSHWLARELEAGGVSEDQLMWLNASSLGHFEVPMLHSMKVVALGRIASAKLNDYNVVHTMVEHPQSHRRFQQSKPYPLAAHIKELLTCT